MKLKYFLTLISSCFIITSGFSITFSGKITNATESEINIYGLNLNASLLLNSDGTFSKEIDVKHNGIYTFNKGSNSWELYLTTDSNLIVNFDQNNIDESIVFIGNTANESMYLFQKNKLYNTQNFNQVKIFSQKEEAFVNSIDNLLKTNLDLLKNATIANEFFRKTEEKNIFYVGQSYYHNYKYSYSYYTKSSIPKTKLCDSRIINRDTVNFTFDEFLYCSVFRGYEVGKFNTSFKPKFEKNKIKAQEILKEELLKINNPIIEEFILKNVAGQLNYYKDKDNHLINAIVALTKDEYFKNVLLSKIENEGKFINDSAAPEFELNDQNGNKVKLSDFKGKNIYIDFWATWCKPCVGEIPELKKLEEKFKDKNIVFLSISLDNIKDVEKWKSFIAKKELGGTHLIVENAWQSKIVKDYTIESIPRFVIIDAEGNLVDIDAPRPTSGKAHKAINKLENI